MVAAEDSEHAISAYRTACRLLPGDHRAPTYMAKELVMFNLISNSFLIATYVSIDIDRSYHSQLRTNSSTLAIHILQGALRLCPDDPVTLNELGVSSMALGEYVTNSLTLFLYIDIVTISIIKHIVWTKLWHILKALSD